MLLPILLIILLMSFAIFRFSVIEQFQFLGNSAHHFCINQAPQNLVQKNELLALVCAKNFTEFSQSELYISVGLIHLFVVSGAHLVLLENFLSRFFTLAFGEKNGQTALFLTLLLYAFICKLQAPICRALVAYAVHRYFNKYNLHWPYTYQNLIIGLMTITLHPPWVSSLSLQLSWLASFTVMYNQNQFSGRSLLFQQISFYVFLFPALVYLQTPNPMSIVINLIFAPILEFILFPLALLSYFMPFLCPLFDKTIILLRDILSLTELRTSGTDTPAPDWWPMLLWFYIMSLHFGFLLYEQVRMQKRVRP